MSAGLAVMLLSKWIWIPRAGSREARERGKDDEELVRDASSRALETSPERDDFFLLKTFGLGLAMLSNDWLEDEEPEPPRVLDRNLLDAVEPDAVLE